MSLEFFSADLLTLTRNGDRKRVLTYHKAFRMMPSKDPPKGSLASMFSAMTNLKLSALIPWQLHRKCSSRLCWLSSFKSSLTRSIPSVICWMVKKWVLGRYSCHLKDLQLRGVSFTLQIHELKAPQMSITTKLCLKGGLWLVDITSVQRLSSPSSWASLCRTMILTQLNLYHHDSHQTGVPSSQNLDEALTERCPVN